jgi:hypothetical protein
MICQVTSTSKNANYNSNYPEAIASQIVALKIRAKVQIWPEAH